MILNYNFPAAIDNTMRTAWDACQRKFLLGHIYNLRAGDPSEHLVFGGAYARGLEVARKEYYSGNSDKRNYLGKAFIECIREWDTELDDPLIDLSKSLPNCLMAILYYFDEYDMGSDWLKPLAYEDGEAAVEFTFAQPLAHHQHPSGNPMLYAGRLDMLVNYASEPAVYDDKTTSQLGAQWINSWSLNSQMTGYIWAARQAGYNTTTAIIRGVSILKKGNGTAQAIEHRTDWEIASWFDLLNHNLEGMLWSYDNGEDAFLPSYGQACSAYGGCPYKQLCKKENWKDWVEPDFHEYVWDPLALAEGGVNT